RVWRSLASFPTAGTHIKSLPCSHASNGSSILDETSIKLFTPFFSATPQASPTERVPASKETVKVTFAYEFCSTVEMEEAGDSQRTLGMIMSTRLLLLDRNAYLGARAQRPDNVVVPAAAATSDDSSKAPSPDGSISESKAEEDEEDPRIAFLRKDP